MHINYKKRLLFESQLYINNSDAISFSRSLDCNGDPGTGNGAEMKRDAVDTKCPTNSHQPQISPKSEMLGQKLGASQPQIAVAQGTTLWLSKRNILVHCKAVAQTGAKVIKFVHVL